MTLLLILLTTTITFIMIITPNFLLRLAQNLLSSRAFYPSHEVSPIFFLQNSTVSRMKLCIRWHYNNFKQSRL
jgi:hypothetical protein